jgi:prepilin-type processing-associated H-X9-DG protein/prepilin-type N-terminal cleavage/methylation domain-containing protein
MSFQPISAGVRRAGGFTLVELLVVIGIIGLLISILLPALSKARRQAATSKCLSNLHQMGIALTLYGQENHGLFPPEGAAGGNWMIVIAKYINPTFKNPYDPAYASIFPQPPASFSQQLAIANNYMPKVWFCPEAPLANALPAGNPGHNAVANGGAWGQTTVPWGPGTYGDMYYLSSSYTINGWIYNITYSVIEGGVPGPVHWSGINVYDSTGYANYFVNSRYPFQAANTPSFCDSSWHDAWPLDFVIGGSTYIDAPPSAKGELTGAQYDDAIPAVGTDLSMMCRVAMARHGKAINVAFLDGHASTIPLKQLWSLQWSPLSARMNPTAPIP